MVFGIFPKKQKMPSRPGRKFEKLIRDMGIIAENNSLWRKSGFDESVLLPLILGGVIAIIDKKVDGFVEAPQGRDRIAIQDFAVLVEWLRQKNASARINVRAVIFTGVPFLGVTAQSRT